MVIFDTYSTYHIVLNGLSLVRDMSSRLHTMRNTNEKKKNEEKEPIE